jgi:hypothetical protein
MAARLRTLLRAEDAARVRFQMQGADLRAVRFGIETKARGDRQAGLG